MFKVLFAEKDVYVTDKVVRGERAHDANVGIASTLNLFKLYGITSSGSNPNIELSRAFIKFNLDPIRSMVTAGELDITNRTFSCKLKLFDVDGGQTIPSPPFSLTVHPLSRSFDEGLGRDVVMYQDNDVCNFLTGSRSQGPWVLSGANSGGTNGSIVDYLTSVGSTNLEALQTFVDGTEDLDIDITTIISATLADQIPDDGFRIAFTSSLETDQRTYFVKRFASRHAYDPSFHPRLEFTFDDSIQDDTSNIIVGSTLTMFLHSFDKGSYSNLISGSTTLSGSNCIALRLQVPISGSTLTLVFTGSQHHVGGNSSLPVTGIYSASVLIPENVVVNSLLAHSGSVSFIPIWGSLDGSVGYLTGSRVTAYPPVRGPSTSRNSTFVTITNIDASYDADAIATLRLNVFDPEANSLVVSRIPHLATGQIVRNVHYSVRCVENDKIMIPFDTSRNSTLVSSDAQGMFFDLDMGNLDRGRTYVIDVLIDTNGRRRTFNDASTPFRIKP